MVAPKNTNKTPIDGKEKSKYLSEKRQSQALNRLQATSANLDLFFNSIKTISLRFVSFTVRNLAFQNPMYKLITRQCKK